MDSPRAEKIAVVSEVRERFERSSAAILTEYRGLTVKDMAALRRLLREAGSDYKIYKNTLVRFAAHDLGLDELDSLLTGPTAIAFVEGDASSVAKALREYAKSNPKLTVKGGVLGATVMSVADTAALADLPPREVVLARLAGAFASPMQTFAGLLAALPRNFAYGLKALILKRGGVAEDASADDADAAVGAVGTPAPVEDTSAGTDVRPSADPPRSTVAELPAEPVPVAAEVEPEAELVAEVEPEPVAKVEPLPVAAEPEPAPQPVADAEPAPVVAEPEPAPQPVADAAPEPQPALVAEVEPESVADAEPEPALVADAEPEPALVADVEPEPELVAEVEPAPVVAEPEPVPVVAEVEPEPVVVEGEPEPEPAVVAESVLVAAEAEPAADEVLAEVEPKVLSVAPEPEPPPEPVVEAEPELVAGDAEAVADAMPAEVVPVVASVAPEQEPEPEPVVEVVPVVVSVAPEQETEPVTDATPTVRPSDDPPTADPATPARDTPAEN